MSTFGPKYTGTKIGMLTVLALVTAAIVLTNLFGVANVGPRPGENKTTQYPASLEAVANSCGDIFLSKVQPYQYGELTPAIEQAADKKPTIVLQPPMIVPVYGYVSRNLITRSQVRFYDKTDDPEWSIWVPLRAMYSYDTTIIWYTAGISDRERDSIKLYTQTHPNIMALPWHGRDLPSGRNLAWSTWGISQSCNSWDSEAFEDFQHFKAQHPVARKPLTEVKLNSHGVTPYPGPIYTE